MRDVHLQNNFLSKCRYHIGQMQNRALFAAPDGYHAMQDVCESLRGMGIRNAALLTLPTPLPTRHGAVFQHSESLRLSAGICAGDVIVPQREILLKAEEVPDFLSHSPQRITWTAFCLATEHEILGLLLCEDSFDNYYNDYISSMQISTILKYFSLVDQRSQMESRLHAAMEDLSRKNDMLKMLSTADALTGILNRRGFLEHLQNTLLVCEGPRAGMCMLDLDSLKSINDSFGHAEGDAALCRLVELVQGTLEDDDVLARFGGDEFIILLSRDAEARLRALPDRLREAFVLYNKTSDKPYYIEASCGVLSFVCHEDTRLDTLLHGLDAQLYANKIRKRSSIMKAMRKKPNISLF
jgi:diguanylate cyclase (GGDEF)-like protein